MKVRGPLATLAMASPILVLVIGSLVSLKQFNRLKALRLEEKVIQQDIKTIRQNMVALKSLGDTDKFAATPRLEAEQAGFIDLLQLIARETGVKIDSFRTLPSPPAPAPQPAKAGEPPPPPASKYMPIPTSVTILGSFEQARSFAFSLMRTNRLLNTSQIRWERDRDERFTKLSFVVTRYVKDATPEEIEAYLKEEAAKPKPVIMRTK